jgi:hypothetical protein
MSTIERNWSAASMTAMTMEADREKEEGERVYRGESATLTARNIPYRQLATWRGVDIRLTKG